MARARRVVDRVAVGHDERQPVGGAAQREHHEDGPGRRGEAVGVRPVTA